MSADLLRIDGWLVETETGDVPRVSALDIAERAGLKQVRNILAVVEKNRAELEEHGPISMRTRRMRIEKTGAIGGYEDREIQEPMLNEGQAYNLVALMRTAQASTLRVGLIKLFLAVRDGRVKPVPLDEATVSSARIGDDPAAIATVRLAVGRVVDRRGYSSQRVHGMIRQRFRVSSAWAISMHLLAQVVSSLEAVETRVVALLSPRDERLLVRARKQEAVDRRRGQLTLAFSKGA